MVGTWFVLYGFARQKPSVYFYLFTLYYTYILYTADMPTHPRTHTSTFADDTAFMCMHKNSSVATNILQSHIYNIFFWFYYKWEKWLDLWKIRVNETKCVHVTFTLRKETCPKLKINNITIPSQTHVKYLGIHLDRRLTWTQHIDSKTTQLKIKSGHRRLRKLDTLDLAQR